MSRAIVPVTDLDLGPWKRRVDRDLADYVSPAGGDETEDDGDDLTHPDGSLAAPAGIVVGDDVLVYEPEVVPVASALVVTPGAGPTASWLDVTWSPPVDADGAEQVIGYVVEWTNVATLVLGSSGLLSALSYRAEPLQAGTYDVDVYAITRTGRAATAASSAGVVVTVDTGAPATPTGLVVTAGLRSIVARWNPNAEVDVANGTGEYEVRVAEDAAMSVNVRTSRTGGTVVAFTDLVAGTTYHVDVRAIDASGNASPRTAPPTAITPGGVSGADLGPGSIGSTHLAADSVLATHIAAGNVGADELAAGAVIAGKITAGSVGTNELAANSVTASRLAAIVLEVGKYVRSSNYVAGVSGFNWDGTTGDLEANSGTFRGTILGATITGGVLRTAAAGARTEITQTGGRGRITFHSGHVDEAAPAYIEAGDTGFGQFDLVIRGPEDEFGLYNEIIMSADSLGGFPYTQFNGAMQFNNGIRSDGNVHLYPMGGDPGLSLMLDAPLTIGYVGGQNLGIDANEIQARNNGAGSTLFLNHKGGVVQIANGDGTIDLAPTVGLPTTGNPANLRWGTGAPIGRLYQSTSTSRGKQKIADLPERLVERFAALRPVVFESKWPDDDGREMAGFIVEDIREVWPEATFDGIDGEPAEYDYRQVLALTVAVVQRLLDGRRAPAGR